MIAGPGHARPGDYEELSTDGSSQTVKSKPHARLGEASSPERHLGVENFNIQSGMMRAVRRTESSGREINVSCGGGQGCSGTEWAGSWRLVDL